MISLRVDKFLKNCRLIKRRTIAKEACEKGRVLINGNIAKPGSEISIGDLITILFSGSEIKVRVKELSEHVSKESASEMYEVIE